MKVVLPVAAMLCTALGTLAMLGFCMAMGANASPEQLRALKFWMIGFSALSAVGIVAGFVLMRGGLSNVAAGVAILPCVIMAVIFIIALLK